MNNKPICDINHHWKGKTMNELSGIDPIHSATIKMEYKYEAKKKDTIKDNDSNFYESTAIIHGYTDIRGSLEQSEPTDDRVNHYERLRIDTNDDLDTAGNQRTSIQSQPIDKGIDQYERLRIDETIPKRNKNIQDDVQNRDKTRPPLDKKERKKISHIDSRYYKDNKNRINGLRKYVFRQNLIIVVIFSILIIASYALVILAMTLVIAPDRKDGGWSNWGLWEDCSSSCGVGMRLRNRMCDDPKPLTNGKQCLGNSQDVILCNEQACPKS